MIEQVDRLWRILHATTMEFDPLSTAEPTVKDTLFVQLLLEASTSENRFRQCISANRAICSWALEKRDEELSYLIRLQRGQYAA